MHTVHMYIGTSATFSDNMTSSFESSVRVVTNLRLKVPENGI